MEGRLKHYFLLNLNNQQIEDKFIALTSSTAEAGLQKPWEEEY